MKTIKTLLALLLLAGILGLSTSSVMAQDDEYDSVFAPFETAIHEIW